MALDLIRRRALQALVPPARLPLSEWMEAAMVLPQETSAMPGKVRLWPYQRAIADAMTDPEVERVTLVKSVRVGFTTLMTGALASFVANEPAPVLALLPTEADARDFVVSDLEPVFDATPSLRGLLSADQAEGGRSTLMHRRFPGGSLKVVAAKSPRNLRRHNVRVLLIDEADAMEPGSEGSAIRLAERRTLSFPDRKIIMGSTPLHAETSNVLRAYQASDMRVFEVPCPECGVFFEIMWSHIEWAMDRPETAACRCPNCKTLVPERFKAEMVEAGAWRATRPEIEGHAGFRLNALVSLLANASWTKLAAEFLQAKSDPAELQTFVNTILAEGWREAVDEVDEAALMARAEPFSLEAIPVEVLALSAGVDVQDDRLEATVLGWARDGSTLVLGHVVIWGAPDDETSWRELDELLTSRWKHPAGGWLKVDAAVIDAGDGEHMARVRAFCASRGSRRVMAGKGAAGARPPLQASHQKARGVGRLMIVGVDGLKAALASRLARGSSIRFSDTLEAVWFEQLASERRTLRYVRGQPVRRFERIPGRRAEALDCVVYGLAARHALTINWDSREADLAAITGLPVEQRQRVARSRWMSV
jgi:phage terminase large subunit GpA-like protein